MTTPEGPADTTMMRIVHDALRRDLARATATLAEPARTSPRQRRAIGQHLTWMMGFVHAHHASEDEGLYPLVRTRAGDDDAVLAVLDRMRRQHDAIAAAIAGVEAMAGALATDPSDEAVRSTHDTTRRTRGGAPPAPA